MRSGHRWLNSQGRYRLLVFDWDGTLADSTALIASAIQRACRDIGEPVPGDVAARHVIGLGLADALAHVAPGLPPERHRDLSWRVTATTILRAIRKYRCSMAYAKCLASSTRRDFFSPWPPASRALASTGRWISRDCGIASPRPAARTKRISQAGIPTCCCT